MRYYRDILESLADPDAPDVLRMGAVAMATEIVDAHVQDPTIRKAWTILRDVVIESWIEKVGVKEFERENSIKGHNIDPEPVFRDDDKSISLSSFENAIKIGRLPTSHVRFDDDSVARMHAIIDKVSPAEAAVWSGPGSDGRLNRIGPKWRITDLGSASGTKLNGVEIKNSIVEPGDVLQFGNCTLRIME